MKADLGMNQQLLEAANAKPTKVEETTARLTSSLTGAYRGGFPGVSGNPF